MHLPSFRVDKFHLKQHTRNNASINEIRHNQNKYKYVKTITYKKTTKLMLIFLRNTTNIPLIIVVIKLIYHA